MIWFNYHFREPYEIHWRNRDELTAEGEDTANKIHSCILRQAVEVHIDLPLLIIDKLDLDYGVMV